MQSRFVISSDVSPLRRETALAYATASLALLLLRR